MLGLAFGAVVGFGNALAVVFGLGVALDAAKEAGIAPKAITAADRRRVETVRTFECEFMKAT